METQLLSRTDTEVQFRVTLDEAYLAAIKTAAFDELRPRVKAAGFRPGKAPDMIVERELGSDTVQHEVVDQAVRRSYPDAIKQHDVQIISSPQISLEKFVPYTELVYKVTAELLPKVKLPNYKKFRLKRPAIKIEPAEIDRTIEDLRRREATRITSEQPAKKSDEVVFDFAGTKGGAPVPGATATKQTLQLGSGQFIPGFEEQLTGLKAGAEKTFEIRFPKDYHEKTLADQLVSFKIKLHSVTELVLPEVNEAFVAKVSPFKTLAELKADITAKLTAEKAEAATRSHEQAVLDKLLKESTYKTPKALVEQQLSRLRAEVEQNLAYSGLDLAKYLDLSGKTRDQLDAEMRPEAERRVGLALVLTEVATAEQISISAADLDAEIARLKQDYPDPTTQAELDNPNTREEVYNHLMSSKVIAQLVAYADGK